MALAPLPIFQAVTELVAVDFKMDFPGWPVFDEEMIDAATVVLRSGKTNNWVGEQCTEFEKEFAEVCDVKYAVAVSNGTVALEAALYALGVGAGNEVIVPCRTYIASASCVVRSGAKPVMADVDPVSQTITAETIRAQLTEKTKAVVLVHLAGWPCDMQPILELAEEHGFYLIEDCAQAHGAFYQGRSVGSLGDIAAFSFCQDKILTTAGEGGMVVTNKEHLWKRIWSYKDHGKDYDTVFLREHAPGFRWLHESFGTNGRMTEVQAAVGRVALRKLSEWVQIRRRNAAILDGYLAGIPAIRRTPPPEECYHSYYKYYAFVKPTLLREGWSRDRIMDEICQAGIPCFSGSCSEVYLEKAFSASLRPASRLPAAQRLGETSLMFLVHPTLTEEHMNFAGSAIADILSKASIRGEVAAA